MFDLFTAEMSTPVRFVVAFTVVLALIGVTFFLYRRFGGTGTVGGGRGRVPRLGVLDHANLDGRRRLVLIRRDNVEHLLLIGGPSDVVVEANIQRAIAPPREMAPVREPEAHFPAAEAPYAEAPRAVPPRRESLEMPPRRERPEAEQALRPPPELSLRPLPEPPRPPIEPPLRPAPALRMPETPAREPRPTTDLDEFERMLHTPHPEPTTPSPGLRLPPELEDFPTRHDLRAAGGDAPAAPRAAPEPPATPAMPRPDPLQSIRPAASPPAALPDAAPRTAPEQPSNPATPRPDDKAARTVFDNLEDEMASLLGRGNSRT